jgi:hypothetical protein
MAMSSLANILGFSVIFLEKPGIYAKLLLAM